MVEVKLSQDTMVEEALNLQVRMFNLITEFNKLDERFQILMKEMNVKQAGEFNERFSKMWKEWNG